MKNITNDKTTLQISGVDSLDLVKQYGTPLYVMDENEIRNMCKIYTETLNEYYGQGKIYYASKAFCCKEIYRLVSEYKMGADSVSLGELYTAISAGFNPENLCLHGNNKLDSEIKYAIENNVGLIVIDSLSDFETINKYAKESNKTQNVLIRVNPGIEAHTHHYIQTSKVDSKFGFSIDSGEAFNAIEQCLKHKNIKLCGLHCHIGSQIFDINSFSLAIEKMALCYKTIYEKYNLKFSIINLGGGIGITYNENDLAFTYDIYKDYVRHICQKLSEEVKKYNLEKPFLILEPGRSIVGKAGTTLYTVGNVKHIKNVKDYVAIDGGMFENPRYALYQAKYTVLCANKLDQKPDRKYSVAGKCCESGDLIAEEVLLPEIEKGDILAVTATGAYNYSMASNYNKNCIPTVVFVKDGKSKIVVKGQKLEQLIQNDV